MSVSFFFMFLFFLQATKNDNFFGKLFSELYSCFIANERNHFEIILLFLVWQQK